MFRIEYNLETGERREIEQTAYRSPTDPTRVVVLDATEPAPEGMEAFDPAAVDTAATDPVPS
jgi:hypothetical protein